MTHLVAGGADNMLTAPSAPVRRCPALRRIILLLAAGLLLPWSGPMHVPAAQPAVKLDVRKAGRHLAIDAQLPPGIDQIELRIESERNGAISRYYDVSPHHPDRDELLERNRDRDRNEWYPVVDVALEPGMEAVARFDGPADGGFYTINAMYHRDRIPFAPEIVIPPRLLEYWENALFVLPSTDRSLDRFYLRHRLRPVQGGVRHVYQLLTDDWGGRVSIHAIGAGADEPLAERNIERTDAAWKADALNGFRGTGISRARLLEGLRSSVEFTLRAQNENPHSPTYGGFFMLYDVDAGLYRTSHWIWSWGPSIRLLLDAARMPEFGSESARLIEAARRVGDTAIRFQINHPHHPTDGLVVAGWTQGILHEYSSESFRISAGPDALWLAAWGWGALYEVTRDEKYLAAFTRLARATDKLLQTYEFPPQVYLPEGGIPVGLDQGQEDDRFGPVTIDEAMFGMEGYAELYRLTGDEYYRNLGRTFIEQFAAKLEREDGTWATGWNRATRELWTRRDGMSRSMAWVMEGLLAAHRLLPEEGYLPKAIRQAEHLLEAQHETGYWQRMLPDPLERTGISEKSTAIWSYLLYRLHAETGDPRHLEAARRALLWCLENQYIGPDSEAHGSILGRTISSGIGYRQWFDLSCIYTSGFFGLAIIEELNQTPRSRENWLR
jgi:hypothetical protein